MSCSPAGRRASPRPKSTSPRSLTAASAGNLLSKYSMIGRFIHTEDSLDFLEAGIQQVLNIAASHPTGRAVGHHYRISAYSASPCAFCRKPD